MEQLSSHFPLSGGATNTQDALRVTSQSIFTPSAGDRPSARNVIVVVTDGQSNIDATQTLPMANASRQQGIELFVVAIGDNPNMEEINGIANQPTRDHVITGLMTSSNVTSSADRLLDLLCSHR